MIFCIAILLEISQKMSLTFLDASMHHYNRVCLSVGWLVNRTVGWLVSWSVSRLVGWSVGGLIHWMVGRLVGWLVDWLPENRMKINVNQ